MNGLTLSRQMKHLNPMKELIALTLLGALLAAHSSRLTVSDSLPKEKPTAEQSPAPTVSTADVDSVA
jgi:hypothetical protein